MPISAIQKYVQKKKAPWLEACCSVKAILQTYSNMVNHRCSKETFKLHIQPLRGKNKSSKRTDEKRALCADAVPDGVSKAVGGSGRTQHPLLPGARGFGSLGGHLPACGSEHWDFQLPLVIHVAALASGTWKWDIPTVFRTSEVCTYSSAPHILFFFFFPSEHLNLFWRSISNCISLSTFIVRH